MRYGSTQPRDGRPTRTSFGWRTLFSVQVVFGVGLSVYAFAFAWPVQTDGMRDLATQSSETASRWGRVQALAIGTTGILPVERSMFDGLQPHLQDKEAAEQRIPAGTEEIPESLLKLEPPSQEMLDDQALAEIAMIRTRLGGSVLDALELSDDGEGSVHDSEVFESPSGRASSGQEADFLELLRVVLHRTSGSIPWRPLVAESDSEVESATIMTPTIVFEGPLEEQEPKLNAPTANDSFPVEQAEYHRSPTGNSPGATEAPRCHSQPLAHQLREWARELDSAAADVEDHEHYDQADSLRRLAQAIRVQAREIISNAPPRLSTNRHTR